MSKVVNIFSARQKDTEERPEKETEETSETLFAETVERNKRNKDRVAAERLKANKSVLRSYRIKN